jgi:hypothetical protein
VVRVESAGGWQWIFVAPDTILTNVHVAATARHDPANRRQDDSGARRHFGTG